MTDLIRFPIAPHGGILIDRYAAPEQRQEWLARADTLPSLVIGNRAVSDAEMIADGAFSPLEGFLCKADYDAVVDTMRLRNGLAWTIPITLPAGKTDAKRVKEGNDAALFDRHNRLIAILHVEEIFEYDLVKEAEGIYRTAEDAHPAVAKLRKQGPFYIGGKITLINRNSSNPFPEERRTPLEVRRIFMERGWKRIVAFQTRNPIHRAHEYIQKCALETADGLLLHPLVGETKSDDIDASTIMRCYRTILEKYYPADRTLLSVFPAKMHYAGPREAVFHALCRKNYGCTHFIVGRDHAGVGNYYGSYDAHKIFEKFRPEEIGITPLFFEHTFFCLMCGGMGSSKTCPHPPEHHIALSGTKLRTLLREGVKPPPEFSRPEVAQILISSFHDFPKI